MMVKIIVALLFFLFVGQMCTFAQLLDREEDRLTVQEPPVAVEVDAAAGGAVVPAGMARTDKEVKYVAGKDGLWFTRDDEVYHYFVIEHTSGGLAAKRTCYKPDATVFDFQVFEYSSQGRLLKEISFDGQGNKQFDALYSYDATGRKTRVVRYNPAGQEISSMGFEYDARGLLIKDFEYKGKNLEKYHMFEYDKKKRMIRAMEYKSLDGPIFATKEFFYNRDGSKSKECKFTGPGPDNVWFTKDDVMQYYTLFEYGKAS